MVVRRLLDSPPLQRAVAELYLRGGFIDSLCRNEAKQHGSAFRILRYQRIARFETLPYAPYLTSVVSPKALNAQLQHLKNTTEVISLVDLLNNWLTPQLLPKRCVVLTFDGGWVEHGDVVKNMLDEFAFHATFLVPTAFIETMNMFWHDKVQAIMLSMAKAQLPMPSFETLNVEVNFLLQQPDPTVTPFKVLILLEVLAQIPKADLSLFLQELGAYSVDVPIIELPRNFLRWEELRAIEQSGNSIATLGHTHRRLTDIPREEIAIEAHTAFHELRQNGLTPLPMIAAPDGELTPAVCETLQAIGCNVCLTIGRERAQGDLNSILTLQRVPIFEHASSGEALFACRIWGPKVLGHFIA